MANFLQTLIPLLSSLAMLLALANPARSQTTSFTYDFYGDQPTTLIYQGDAHFPSTPTYLRLTKTNASGAPQSYSIGRVVHTSPVLFRCGGSQADFETTIKFLINRVDYTPPSEGITFFIAPVGFPIPAGSTGGYFGLFNYPSGSSPSVFAVEFDNFSDGWDPSYRHVGIDIESNRSSNVTRVDDALMGQEVTARINYVGATKLITVNIAAGSQNFEVSYVYDLSTILPEQVQVGISGTSGLYVATHDVISWYFTSTIVHNVADEAAHIRQIV